MIIPSIIAKSFEEVKQKIEQIEDLCEWVQLDIMDGRFVLPVTWDVPEDLNRLNGRIKIEAHLMVREPEEVIPEWRLYTDRIIVHLEATDKLDDLLNTFSGSVIGFGVALKADTPLSVLEPYRDRLRRVQLMSAMEIGYYGAKFDERVYDRIKELRTLIPQVEISVDGGVSVDNATSLLAAGADNLIVGSAIWDSADIAQMISELKRIS